MKKTAKLISLLLTLVLLIGVIPSVTVAPGATVVHRNLLINPGAETGDLTGWSDSSEEQCWMTGFEGVINGWEHQAAHSGSYYFIAGWPNTREENRYLYQNVDISPYAGRTLTFEGYIGGANHRDEAGLYLVLFNEDGDVIDTATTQMYNNVSVGDWIKETITVVLPANARTVTVSMVAALYEGAECDAYFDDLSLTVSGGSVVPEPDPVEEPDTPTDPTPADPVPSTGGNLLINPGAETGDLTGWIDDSGEQCWMMGFEGVINGWDHPAAHSGQYYFIAGWPNTREDERYLHQMVDISPYVGQTLTFEGYIGGSDHRDQAGLSLVLLSEDGDFIDAASTQMHSNVSVGEWIKETITVVIPPNASSVIVSLVAALYEGAECDAYFDDLSLTVSGSGTIPDNPTDNPPIPDTPITPDTPDTGIGSYYLLSYNNGWGTLLNSDYKFTRTDNPYTEEYVLQNVYLTGSDKYADVDGGFKAAFITTDKWLNDYDYYTWYPDGKENNIFVSTSGRYDIYFRPNGDGTAAEGYTEFIHYSGDGCGENNEEHASLVRMATRGGRMFKTVWVGSGQSQQEPTDNPSDNPTNEPSTPDPVPSTSGNLLRNPGGEDKYAAWIDSSEERCWKIGYEGTIEGYSHPAPHSGSYYIIAGWPSAKAENRYLYQDVDISPYIGQTLTFSGYLGGYGQSDEGSLSLVLFDESGATIDVATTKIHNDLKFGEWIYESVSLTIPPNARTAEACLVAALYEGSECDAYFDDLSLTVSGSANVSAVLKGDVNCDGKVNNRDAVILDRYIAGWQNYDAQIKSMRAAELSGDGTVNNRDAIILDRYIAGWQGYDRYIVTV